jgi:DNA transposition AAA+ family ATPase
MNHYADADVALAAKISEWLTKQGKSRAWMREKTRISSTTISQVLGGKYPSAPSQFLADMATAIEIEESRASGGTPGYVQGTVHKLVNVVADRTRKHANFGVVAGRVGVGKTRTLVEYQRVKAQTLLLLSSPKMTAGVMLNELLRQLGCVVPTGLDNKFQEVVRAVRGTNYLLMVDEAENVSAPALEYLRRIRDMASVGVLLVGTEKLHGLLNHRFGQFDQIRSRVAMWPKTIECIPRDDADDMAREALADMGEVSDEVLDALWAYATGSARVLMEGLVPGLRDFGRGKQLTAAVVDQVAERVLSIGKGGRR